MGKTLTVATLIILKLLRTTLLASERMTQPNSVKSHLWINPEKSYLELQLGKTLPILTFKLVPIIVMMIGT